MSKTIDTQIEKSTRLIEALRQHIGDVQDKGVTIDGLDAMARRLDDLRESSKVAEDLRARLSAQVKNTNAILADCKRAYAETKAVVRNNYPQEQWLTYGVTDKR